MMGVIATITAMFVMISVGDITNTATATTTLEIDIHRRHLHALTTTSTTTTTLNHCQAVNSCCECND